MVRKLITRPGIVPVMLVLQLVPLLLFPVRSYAPNSQEWWLPVLLAFFALVGLVQLLVRRSAAPAPWYLISFAQGFNIISRLLLLMPHAMVVVDKQDRLNTSYVLLTLLAMLWSAFLLWYSELPEVRSSFFRSRPARAA